MLGAMLPPSAPCTRGISCCFPRAIKTPLADKHARCCKSTLPSGRLGTTEECTDARAVCCADASIWLVQFIKAMRNQEGDLVRNAHLIGFFRRICKCAPVCLA